MMLRRIVEMVVSNDSSSDIVESDSFRRLVDYLRPGTSTLLPSADVFIKIFDRTAVQALASMEAAMKIHLGKGYWPGICIDAWGVDSTINVTGVVLSSGSQAFALEFKLKKTSTTELLSLVDGNL